MLPVVPRHYTIDSSGVPISPPSGTALKSDTTLAALQKRVDRLNDEDRIRNLQSAYGFYQDRKMWDDVVDLFAGDGVVEVGGQDVWRGKTGVRRWLETMGPAGLRHGSSMIASSSMRPSRSRQVATRRGHAASNSACWEKPISSRAGGKSPISRTASSRTAECKDT
jgi:hypothetical protein